jgi:hypothetical protein
MLTFENAFLPSPILSYSQLFMNLGMERWFDGVRARCSSLVACAGCNADAPLGFHLNAATAPGGYILHLLLQKRKT